MAIHRQRIRTAFYRSPATRWFFAVSGLALALAVSPLGPPAWKDTPSLRFLHIVLTYPVMSLGLVLYAGLLMSGRLRLIIAGDLLGACIYGCGFVAMLVTTRFSQPTNPLAVIATLGYARYHLKAARLAEMDRSEQRGGGGAP